MAKNNLKAACVVVGFAVAALAQGCGSSNVFTDPQGPPRSTNLGLLTTGASIPTLGYVPAPKSTISDGTFTYAADQVVVQLAPDATEADLRFLLANDNLGVLTGSITSKLYYLAVPQDRDVRDVVSDLQSNPHVASASLIRWAPNG